MDPPEASADDERARPGGARSAGGAAEPDVELTVVTGTFDARAGRESELAAVLARYVVLTRGAPGCRNVDLSASPARPGRYLVVEKWADPRAQRAHLDAAVTVDMARAATPILASKPELELWSGVSAHDLR